MGTMESAVFELPHGAGQVFDQICLSDEAPL
jgi:hypothetical protein